MMAAGSTRAGPRPSQCPGGIKGHPIQLVWKDYQSSSSQAVTDFCSLAGDGVVALLRPLDSPADEAMEPVAERLGPPTVAEVSDLVVVVPAKPDFFWVMALPQYWSTPLVQRFQYTGGRCGEPGAQVLADGLQLQSGVRLRRVGVSAPVLN
ncbi:MAG: ABC transporter substrate-binding protein [Firmicutes bacterium]|nr:ABC transporter substrate-binding protein [Alicyclobacillaceae bacterium]MCL6498341.1 ABC transporter substrate-binding protein [Bacillota bacterium]